MCGKPPPEDRRGFCSHTIHPLAGAAAPFVLPYGITAPDLHSERGPVHAPASTPVNPTLVVLAAGLSTRYGSPKQLEGVGPSGEKLLEYALFDALRAGFDHAVILSQPDFQPVLERRLERAPCPITVCVQPADGLPPGRRKPWGTAHAVLSVEAQLSTPFAVINADDFYGQGAFRLLGTFLQAAASDGPPEFALVGYHLRDTVSEAGGVSRAICRHDAGRLETIVEVSDIHETTDGFTGRDEDGVALRLTGDETTSMNAWGFTPAFFPLLRQRFAAFRSDHAGDLQAEFRLSTEVNGLVAAGQAKVRILPTDEHWVGMTHPGDRDRVRAQLAELVAAGRYPPSLFSAG